MSEESSGVYEVNIKVDGKEVSFLTNCSLAETNYILDTVKLLILSGEAANQDQETS